MNRKDVIFFIIGSIVLIILILAILISVGPEEPGTNTSLEDTPTQQEKSILGFLEMRLQELSQQLEVTVGLTVKLENPTNFPKSGSASLQDEPQSASSCFVPNQLVDYTIQGVTLHAVVEHILRPERTPRKFKCTLQVKDTQGKVRVFAMRESLSIPPLAAGMRWGVHGLGLAVLAVSFLLVIFIWWCVQLRHPPEIVRRTPEPIDTNRNLWEEILDITVWHCTSLDLLWDSEESWLTDDMLHVSFQLDGSGYGRQANKRTWTSMRFYRFGVLLPLKKTFVLRLQCRAMSPTGLPAPGNVKYLIREGSLPKYFQGVMALENLQGPPPPHNLPQTPMTPELTDSSSAHKAQNRRDVETSLAALVAWQKNIDHFLGLETLLPIFKAATASGLRHIQPPHIEDEASAEEAMLATVNHWWREGGDDRDALQSLLDRIGLRARFYALTHLSEAASQVETPFSFEASDAAGGWLWFQPPGEREALALPADPTYFVTHQVMGLVQRMFEGFALERLPTPMRFYKAYRACRLQAVPGEHGKFRLLHTGYMQMFSGAPTPLGMSSPSTYATLMARRQASRAHISSGQSHVKLSLQTLVEEIAKQSARSLYDPAFQQISQQLQNINYQTFSQKGIAGSSSDVQYSQKLRDLEDRVIKIMDQMTSITASIQAFQELSNTVQQLVGEIEELKSSVKDISTVVEANRYAQDIETARTASLQDVHPMTKQETESEENTPSPNPKERISIANLCESDGHSAAPASMPNETRVGTDDASAASPVGVHLGTDSEVPAFAFDLIASTHWREVMEKAYTASGGRQTDRASSPTPKHYVQRLLHLHVALEDLSTSLSSRLWIPFIAHLDIKESQGFVVHRMLSSPQADGLALSCPECATWVEQQNFQAFLGIEPCDDPTTLLVALPLGSLLRDKYPRGYRRLLTPVSSSLEYVTAVLAPAVLRKRVDMSRDVWEVTAPMRVQYEE